MKFFSVAAIVALAAIRTHAIITGGYVLKNELNYPLHVSEVAASSSPYGINKYILQPGEVHSCVSKIFPKQPGGRQGGMSVKMCKDDLFLQGQIMQFEYTAAGDGLVWYDMSQVDGSPWGDDYAIWSNTSAATPFERAYKYPNDDPSAMQESVPDDSWIFYKIGSTEIEAPAYFRVPCDAPMGDQCPTTSLLGGGQTYQTASSSAAGYGPPPAATTAPSYAASSSSVASPVYNDEAKAEVGNVGESSPATSSAVDVNTQAPAGYPQTTFVTHTATEVATVLVTTYVKRDERPHHTRHTHHQRAQ